MIISAQTSNIKEYRMERVATRHTRDLASHNIADLSLSSQDADRRAYH